MPLGVPSVVYHGPTTFIPLAYDPYTAPKEMGIFKEIASHAFQHVNAGEIVDRILKSREAYEERQRAKLQKGTVEEQTKADEAASK
jgi:ethanolamine-phosphate cytidylyltransferase